jgi:hypothetical protein
MSTVPADGHLCVESTLLDWGATVLVRIGTVLVRIGRAYTDEHERTYTDEYEGSAAYTEEHTAAPTTQEDRRPQAGGVATASQEESTDRAHLYMPPPCWSPSGDAAVPVVPQRGARAAIPPNLR